MIQQVANSHQEQQQQKKKQESEQSMKELIVNMNSQGNGLSAFSSAAMSWPHDLPMPELVSPSSLYYFVIFAC
jgi:hypothetical protein